MSLVVRNGRLIEPAAEVSAPMTIAGEKKRQNVFQALAAALYSVPAAYFLFALFEWSRPGSGTVPAPGAPEFVSAIIAAIPIAVFATRLPLWGATAFFGLVLACAVSMVYLWIAHAMAKRDADLYLYADAVAYGGLGFSAFVLFGLLVSIDSRRRTVHRGRAIFVSMSAAAILAGTASFAYTRHWDFAGAVPELYLAAACCLHALAIWSATREDHQHTASADETGANAA